MTATNFKELEIDTKGTCLLCLETKVDDQITNCNSETLPSLKGLKHFLRYLKVNPKELFNCSSEFLQSMEIREDIYLKINLCSRCSSVTERFNKLYQEYELIQIQFTDCVQSMYQSISKGNENPELVRKYNDQMRPTKTSDLVNASMAANLRSETLKKCTLKMQSGIPRVALLQKPKHKTQSPPTLTGVSASNDKADNIKETALEPVANLRRKTRSLQSTDKPKPDLHKQNPKTVQDATQKDTMGTWSLSNGSGNPNTIKLTKITPKEPPPAPEDSVCRRETRSVQNSKEPKPGTLVAGNSRATAPLRPRAVKRAVSNVVPEIPIGHETEEGKVIAQEKRFKLNNNRNNSDKLINRNVRPRFMLPSNYYSDYKTSPRKQMPLPKEKLQDSQIAGSNKPATRSALAVDDKTPANKQARSIEKPKKPNTKSASQPCIVTGGIMRPLLYQRKKPRLSTAPLLAPPNKGRGSSKERVPEPKRGALQTSGLALNTKKRNTSTDTTPVEMKPKTKLNNKKDEVSQPKPGLIRKSLSRQTPKKLNCSTGIAAPVEAPPKPNLEIKKPIASEPKPNLVQKSRLVHSTKQLNPISDQGADVTVPVGVPPTPKLVIKKAPQYNPYKKIFKKRVKMADLKLSKESTASRRCRRYGVCCEHCPEKFMPGPSVKSHTILKHPEHIICKLLPATVSLNACKEAVHAVWEYMFEKCSSQYGYKCQFCVQHFGNKETFKRHLISAHEGIFAGKVNRQLESLPLDEAEVPNDKLTSDVTDQNVDSPSVENNLDVPSIKIKLKEPARRKSYVCQYCDYVTRFASALRFHSLERHPTDNVMAFLHTAVSRVECDAMVNLVLSQIDETGDVCFKCGTQLAKKALRRHVVVHHFEDILEEVKNGLETRENEVENIHLQEFGGSEEMGSIVEMEFGEEEIVKVDVEKLRSELIEPDPLDLDYSD